MKARVSLEQWQALIAVVESGGYAQAAEALDKSQSAVSYAVQQLETRLGLRAFQLDGRRAVLTPVGRMLYQRARHLVEDALLLEAAGQQLAAGAEARVRIATDTLFPAQRLLAAIARVNESFPATCFELLESTLSGPNEALLAGQAELAVTAYQPPGMLGEPLTRITLEAVAAPQHPLHQLGRELHWNDLRKNRQVVVRDTGLRDNRDAGWLGAEQRLTVTLGSTALQAIQAGLAFAWLPQYLLESLPPGSLKPLPLATGRLRHVDLLLVQAAADCAGPASRALTETLLAG